MISSPNAASFGAISVSTACIGLSFIVEVNMPKMLTARVRPRPLSSNARIVFSNVAGFFAPAIAASSRAAEVHRRRERGLERRGLELWNGGVPPCGPVHGANKRSFEVGTANSNANIGPLSEPKTPATDATLLALNRTVSEAPVTEPGRPPVERGVLPIIEREVYVRGAPIASGGMGRISEARDTRLDRIVAIKELLEPEPRRSRARFEREALITARLAAPRDRPGLRGGAVAERRAVLRDEARRRPAARQA